MLSLLLAKLRVTVGVVFLLVDELSNDGFFLLYLSVFAIGDNHVPAGIQSAELLLQLDYLLAQGSDCITLLVGLLYQVFVLLAEFCIVCF
jgi:hypothetical protein